MKRVIWANIFLLIMWVLFMGKVDLEVCLLGILVIFILQWLYYKKINESYFGIVFSPYLMWCFIRFVFVLIYEVLKANIQVAIVILSPKLEISQGYFFYKTKFKTDFLKMIFANSITLTPGTISVQYDGDILMIHHLTKDNVKGIENSKLEKILLEMEAVLCSK